MRSFGLFEISREDGEKKPKRHRVTEIRVEKKPEIFETAQKKPKGVKGGSKMQISLLNGIFVPDKLMAELGWIMQSHP